MAKRLQVRLLPNWARAENAGGPATFYRADHDDSGALQVTLSAEYTGGEVPNPSPEYLVALARRLGRQNDAGDLVEEASGACALGTFGTAVFRSEATPRFQLWFLSNGRDFVLATHICVAEPEPAEVVEARRIVEMLGLSD